MIGWVCVLHPHLSMKQSGEYPVSDPAPKQCGSHEQEASPPEKSLPNTRELPKRDGKGREGDNHSNRRSKDFHHAVSGQEVCRKSNPTGHTAPPKTPMKSRRLMSAPRLRTRHRIGSN